MEHPRHVVELLPGPHRVVGREAQAEAVPIGAGPDVQVDVILLLPGRLTVREEEVDAFTPKARCPEARCRRVRDAEHLRTVLRIEIREP